MTTGTGEERRGDRISSDKRKAISNNKAGNQEGKDIYETEITLEELMDYIVEDLDLPNLDRKKYSEIIVESATKRGYQKYGVRPRLAKKKNCYV